MREPRVCAPPDPNPKIPVNVISRGACDCHFHVFDDPSPQVPERSYTGPRASLRQYQALQRALGLDRAVIVQPSIYGTDNRTTLEALPDDGSMRAVVVVNDDASVGDLKALSAKGAIGARVNLLFASDAQLDDLKALTKRMADVGWHLQILADLSQFTGFAEFAEGLPVPVVVDHMGHIPASDGADSPAFQALLRSMDRSDVWVKLSGAYRLTSRTDGIYRDVAPLAQALVAANPDQLVWGSDWPHPSFNGPMPNDGDLLDMLFDWADQETVHKILVDNPERLYGFPPWEPSHDG